MANMGAVFTIDAKNSKPNEQWALNRGSGGQVLRAKYGSVARAEVRNGVGAIFPGVSGNFISTPADATTSLLGSVEIVARLDAFPWVTNVPDVMICGKYGSSAASREYAIAIQASKLAYWYGDGTTAFFRQSPSALSTVFPSDFVGGWIKVQFDTATSTIYFFAAADQETEPTVWTSLGTGPITAPQVSAPSEPIRTNTSTGTLKGVVKRTIVRNGLGGTTVLDIDFTKAPDLASSFTCSTGQTVTVTAANAVDTNDPLLLPWSGENYVYLPGEIGNQIRIQHSNQISSATTIEYVVRAVFSQPATERHIVGSSSTHWRASLTTSGALRITVLRQGDLATIGNVASGDIPGIFNGNPIWVRARLTPATSVCEYWYSFAATNNRSEVSWTALTGGVGVNVGVPWFTTTGTTMIGTSSTGAGGVPGRYLYGALLIDGDVRAEVDLTKQTISAVGQAVTSTDIDRSASGRKTTIVSRPVWLFGTDDYMEIADNDLLDFGDDEPFTVVAILRMWAPTTGYCRVVSKRTTVALATGYDLTSWNTAYSPYSYVSDGSNAVSGGGGLSAATGGSLQAWAFVKSSATVNTLYQGNTTGLLGTANLGSVSNAEVFRIGSAANNAGYSDMELLAVGVFRRALTAAEIATIVDAYGVT